MTKSGSGKDKKKGDQVRDWKTNRETGRESKWTQGGQRERLAERLNRHKTDKEGEWQRDKTDTRRTKRETGREIKQTQDGQRERLAERINRHKKGKEREWQRD